MTPLETFFIVVATFLAVFGVVCRVGAYWVDRAQS